MAPMVSHRELKQEAGNQEGQHRDQCKNQSHHKAADRSFSVEAAGVFGMLNPERLKQAPEAVTDMEPQGQDSDNVENRVPRLLQGIADNIGDGEVMIDKVKIEQMHDHKNQDDPSSVYHRLRAQTSATPAVNHSVALGASLAIFQQEEQGKDNMKRENREHRELKDGDQKSQAMEMVGIGEKNLPAQKRGAVADNVDQDK